MSGTLPTIDAATPCASQSRAAAEQLAGSAVGPVRQWLLIEQRERWARDVAGSLPAPIAEQLAQLSLQHPDMRPQLIRRKHAQGPLAVMLVRADRGIVERRDLVSLQRWSDVDWSAVLDGTPLGPVQPRPLYLVCTHGRRDRCCGVRGVPMLQALNALADTDVWQTSHVGGHRFAPTLLYLPHGICYGHVDESEAPTMVRAHRAGHLHRLDRCRGQTRLPAPAQAAALWWRERRQQLQLDAVTGSEMRAADGSALPPRTTGGLPTAVQVRLTGPAGPSAWLHVERREQPGVRAKSCGAEQLPLSQYCVQPVATTKADV